MVITRLLSSVLALGLGFGVALLGTTGAARAGTVPFTATLSFEVVGVPPIVASGAGVATINGSGGGPHIGTLSLPAGAIATTGLVQPITDPVVFPIAGLRLTAANGAGNFVGSGGAMPILGVAKVCLFGACPTAPANLSVPLSVVGVGGVVTVIGPVNLTVTGAPWTTGTAVIGVGVSAPTRMGFRHGPASNTSGTAAGSGVMQLVTPIFISTNIGSSSIIPTFATLTLHFVPEPGTLLLIGAGLAAIGVAGRRRILAREGGAPR
jgi:hypothetical protein